MAQHTTQSSVPSLSVTNVVLSLLIVGFLGAFVYAAFIYEPQVEAADVAPYVDEVQQRLEKHSDVISQEAASLASDALPPIGNAIYQQTKEDYPSYLQALETQGDVYLNETQDLLIAKVQARYREYLRLHREVLREEFPDHASEENVDQVMAEFEQTIDRLVARYYIDEFRREANRTVELWRRFEPIEQPGPNQPSLGEQLADYTADWTVISLADEADEMAEETPVSSEPRTEPPREAATPAPENDPS